MKNIILSADSDRKVYSVPDTVADNLEKYCMEFIDWLEVSPDAKKYRKKGVMCYDESDFILYLNKYVFPKEQSVYVKNLSLGNSYSRNVSSEYKDCPSFNF
ncbi:MAG: hypothetical protein HDT44_12405 [Ruminococcaceae bacterium]|nr:hypothetical protein [Oscillospiraceae bacterium]